MSAGDLKNAKLQSGQLEQRAGFETRPFAISSRNVNHSAITFLCR
jgi:hypothetical protein